MLPTFHKIESPDYLKRIRNTKISLYITSSFLGIIAVGVVITPMFGFSLAPIMSLIMLILMIWFAIYIYNHIRNNLRLDVIDYPDIIVDEKGFFKTYIESKTFVNGLLHENLENPFYQEHHKRVLYDDLANDEDSGLGVHLKWIEKKQEHQLVVYLYQKNEKPVINYEIQSGLTNNNPSNKNEIIARFLLGVKHFRPFINIDPAIFEHYSIDKKNV